MMSPYGVTSPRIHRSAHHRHEHHIHFKRLIIQLKCSYSKYVPYTTSMNNNNNKKSGVSLDFFTKVYFTYIYK